MSFLVRNTVSADYEMIKSLCLAVYPDSLPWSEKQILSHLRVFPEGQFVAVDEATGMIVAMAASLIIKWDEYNLNGSWRDFTNEGMFTNHDPENGRTLYGAEVMVHPQFQGRGIGKLIYQKREDLVREKGLLRIRAGARLRGYSAYASQFDPGGYVYEVNLQRIFDPTLSFQIKRGFTVLSVVSGYLRNDPESLGYAAVIEWLNADVARAEDYLVGGSKFRINRP